MMAAARGFERASALAPDDAGITGELGWALHLASDWCLGFYSDADHAEYSASSVPDGPYTARGVFCGRVMSPDAGVPQLTNAYDAADTDTRRAILAYNLGRIANERGEVDQAVDLLRESLCLRDNDSVRAALARAVWAQGDGLPDTEQAQSLALYRRSLALHQDDDRVQQLAGFVAARARRFAVEAAPPPTIARRTTRFDALCAGLLRAVVTDIGHGDEADARPPGERTCELRGDWVGPSATSAAPLWTVAHLVVHAPFFDDGSHAQHFVVTRARGGYRVMLELGAAHGDSRMENSYVGDVSIEYTPAVR